jgi:hypothetical protein
VKPTYSLSEIKNLIKKDYFRVSETALKNAGQDFGISRSDIALEILALVEDNFYKSMPAEKAPGLFQDVYIKNVKGIIAYIKIQIMISLLLFLLKKSRRRSLWQKIKNG